MRAAIFDLDGTLTDTLGLVFLSVNAALAPIWGGPRSEEEIRKLFGPTEERLIARATAHGREEAIERFFRCYEDAHDRLAHLFPGVREMLLALAQGGTKIGLVTNKGRRSTEISLRRLQLSALVSAIACGDDVERPKPDPAGILQVASALGTSPQEAIYVGDSPGDMLAARAAGAHAVAAGWSSGDRLAAIADEVARTPQEILRILDTPWPEQDRSEGEAGWTSRS